MRGGGRGIFKPQEFFSLSNSLYDFFVGQSMNVFLGLIGVHEFFFSFNFALREIFFVLCPPPPITFLMVRPLSKDDSDGRKRHLKSEFALTQTLSRLFYLV